MTMDECMKLNQYYNSFIYTRMLIFNINSHSFQKKTEHLNQDFVLDNYYYKAGKIHIVVTLN